MMKTVKRSCRPDTSRFLSEACSRIHAVEKQSVNLKLNLLFSEFGVSKENHASGKKGIELDSSTLLQMKSCLDSLASTPERALTDVDRQLGMLREPVDFVLFDLPGTVGTPGVLRTLSAIDRIFVPMKADRYVMESTLAFAS